MIDSAMAKQIVIVDYTNWRGERRKREIVPMNIVWGCSEHHIETQWLLRCYDVEKEELRVFAMINIHAWIRK